MSETYLGVPAWGWLLMFLVLIALLIAIVLMPSRPSNFWKGSLRPGAAPGACPLYCNVLMNGGQTALVTLTYVHRSYPMSAAHGFPHFRMTRGPETAYEPDATFNVTFPRGKGWQEIEAVLELKGPQGRFRQHFHLRWDGAFCMEAAVGICENDASLVWVLLVHQTIVHEATPLAGPMTA